MTERINLAIVYHRRHRLQGLPKTSVMRAVSAQDPEPFSVKPQDVEPLHVAVSIW